MLWGEVEQVLRAYEEAIEAGVALQGQLCCTHHCPVQYMQYESNH
jgi:hypothetical protein